MKNKFRKIVRNLELRWARTSRKRYLAFLKKQGIKIGKNIFITPDVKSLSIDITRPSLIQIGDNVRLNKNLSLITHDGAFYVLLNHYKEFVPGSGKIIIGNNVYFGRNCTVLKGVTIGDNCIIGFGSIVTRDIPSNSVAVGVPAKIICTLDEYYNLRKEKCIKEALDYAKSIEDRFNRRPRIEEFWEEFPLFVNGGDECPQLPIKSQMGKHFEYFKNNNKAIFNGFDDFLDKAGVTIK